MMQRTGRARRRSGFTIIELLITVMIVGVLAGIAIPALNYATLKADAAKMVADSNTIRLAAYEYLAETGRFPASAGYGVVPPQLAPHLPDGFSFTYKNVQYAWFGINFLNANNFWKTRNLGLVVFNYSARPEMADPMRAHEGTDAFWNPTLFFYLYRG